ncbi:hypothetical protein HDV00_010176, partial [Rhizophlyctis rosea]
MRPDAHKSKATRKWKAKHGVAPTPRSSHPPQSHRPVRAESAAIAPAPATGPSRAQHSKAEDLPEDEDERLEAQRQRAKFSRRKLESNAYRYAEPTAEGELADDAAVDRETEDLMELIKNADEDYDPSVYFQFKSEKQWTESDAVDENDDIHRHLLEIDFADLESALSGLPLHVRLGVEDDALWHD